MSASSATVVPESGPPAVATGIPGRAERRGRQVAPLSAPVLAMAGVHKSFIAGESGCSITARVLAGASLRVWPGEVVGVAGGAGAGKSTLLLVAAGMLRPEAGVIAWSGAFVSGDSPAGAPARYLVGPHCLQRREVESALSGGARLLLVDHCAPAALHELRGASGRALERHGAALVIASRDHVALARVASRVLVIRGGRLHGARPPGSARYDHQPEHPRPDDLRPYDPRPEASQPPGYQRKRSAALASSEFPSALARARIRATCGRSFRSPQ